MPIIANIDELRKMKEPLEFAIAVINGLYNKIGEQEHDYEKLFNAANIFHKQVGAECGDECALGVLLKQALTRPPEARS